MTDVIIRREGEHKLAFVIEENGERIAEMIAGISGTVMTIYHTEVSPKFEGQGLAKKLIDAMVEHARRNKWTVNPICSYVRSEFERHPEDYRDVWTAGPT